MAKKKNLAANKASKPERGAVIRAVLGKNLQALLDNLGWGVLELSRRTSFSTHFIASILRGEQNPSIDNLHIIARSLGIEAFQLLNPRFEVPGKSLLLDMLTLSNRDVAKLREKASQGITEPRKNLAWHLKRLLASNDIKAAALAKDLQIAPSTIQKCLKSRQNLTIENLDAIAQRLGVSAFVLLLPTEF
jgi:transcriptional regulator with XRE-family HTH domain